jgi:hypothetical protein
MGAVAEWNIRGMAAAADRYSCPSTKPKFLAFLIHDLKIPFDANRTIIEDCYFRSRHESLR